MDYSRLLSVLFSLVIAGLTIFVFYRLWKQHLKVPHAKCPTCGEEGDLLRQQANRLVYFCAGSCRKPWDYYFPTNERGTP